MIRDAIDQTGLGMRRTGPGAATGGDGEQGWRGGGEGGLGGGNGGGRIEGFSDAVFGFALTLLVVSLEVPRTFAEMADMLRDAPAFAVCFVFLVHFWYMHYRFFRRYGLADITTIVLNAALLFVLLLYVYPLKFMFSTVVRMLTGFGPKGIGGGGGGGGGIGMADMPALFLVFGAGYVAMYLLFALLYVHAYRKREGLGLSATESHEALTGAVVNVACASMGVVSMVIAATVSVRWVQFAGWCYGLVGFVALGAGMWMHRRRPRGGHETAGIEKRG